MVEFNLESNMALPPRSYILASERVPKGIYSLGNGYTLRAVRFSFDVPKDFPVAIPVRAMALSYVDNRSLEVYKDLVVFHSFISDGPAWHGTGLRFGESLTYVFAETAEGLLAEGSSFTFVFLGHNSLLSMFSQSTTSQELVPPV